MLLFAGPGQMDTGRFHPELHFIPDYERVATAAVDYALSRPEVNPERIALLGLSFGGYFSLRAAAYELRIKAVVPHSPIIDLHAYMTSFVGFDMAEMPDEMDFDLDAGVSGPVSGYVFTEVEGADSHCALGNVSFAAAVTYDWLDEVWGL